MATQSGLGKVIKKAQLNALSKCMLIGILWMEIFVVWLLMKMHIISKEVIGHPHYFSIRNVLKF